MGLYCTIIAIIIDLLPELWVEPEKGVTVNRNCEGKGVHLNDTSEMSLIMDFRSICEALKDDIASVERYYHRQGPMDLQGKQLHSH